MTPTVRAAIVVVALVATACSSGTTDSAADAGVPSTSTIDPAAPRPEIPVGTARDFGEPPPIPSGPLAPGVAAAVEMAFGETFTDGLFLFEELEAITALGEADDPRIAWLLSDLLRIARDPTLIGRLTSAAGGVLGIEVSPLNPWGDVTDTLLAWDVPAPPDYLQYKRNIYTIVDDRWEPLFVDGAIDWRLVSWGGVAIDDRPYDTTDDRCNCIPAADNPTVEPASAAAWLDDDDVVFGVEINGEARAYPRQIMEVREMVNDTLGGRDLAMPYCTLCGAAQVYLTDELPGGLDRPILRTSGLLSRSNKVMYDVNTFSVFDTFTGEAVTGPLFDDGIVLPQVSVVTSSWGEWKAAHPETTVLVEELALGRDFDFRNGRDADGPIFPIGDADTRLPVHADVLGVMTDDGTPVAFYVDSALDTLRRGERVVFEGIELVLDGGGVRALDADGDDVVGHQAFWFAWSQFHPDTALWTSSL